METIGENKSLEDLCEILENLELLKRKIPNNQEIDISLEKVKKAILEFIPQQ